MATNTVYIKEGSMLTLYIIYVNALETV